MRNEFAIFVVMMVAAAGITAGVAGYLLSNQKSSTTEQFMSSFSDYSDLADYLDKAQSHWYQNSSMWYSGSPSSSDETRQSMGSEDFSKTNVQVQGVDEADIVKTDGELLFIASYDSVAIVKAYHPDDLMVLSYVNVSDILDDSALYGSIQGIYILDDNLIIVLSIDQYHMYYGDDAIQTGFYLWDPGTEKTMIAIFDVSDPVDPALKDTFEISGYPVTTRMIGDTVYAVSQFYVWKDTKQNYVLPTISEGSSTEVIDVDEIYYDPNATEPEYFMNMMAVDMGQMESNHITLIADYSSAIYMSLDALYLTFQKWNYDDVPIVVFETMSDKSYTSTSIYKIEVNGLQMAVTARGDVKGRLLNQFSMDESDGYLRVATTDGNWVNETNSVYVLNNTLHVVGSIENIAPNERIYSARFVQDTLYLVTFRQVDPLFVIDLSDPTNPLIIGEVKVTGFSTYLHPIDADHILGIGIEGSSMKLSIFDVSNPTAPQEEFRYILENYSPPYLIWDYKAVLFDAEKEMLVIPCSQSSWTNNVYTYTSEAYVFKVSATDGITLRGVIEHGDYQWVERSLYIGEYLYTISNEMVKVNLLSDFSDVNSLQYRNSQYYYGGEPKPL